MNWIEVEVKAVEVWLSCFGIRSNVWNSIIYLSHVLFVYVSCQLSFFSRSFYFYVTHGHSISMSHMGILFLCHARAFSFYVTHGHSILCHTWAFYFYVTHGHSIFMPRRGHSIFMSRAGILFLCHTWAFYFYVTHGHSIFMPRAGILFPHHTLFYNFSAVISQQHLVICICSRWHRLQAWHHFSSKCPTKVCWPSRWSIDWSVQAPTSVSGRPARIQSHRRCCARNFCQQILIAIVFAACPTFCLKQSFAIDPEVVGMWRGTAVIIHAQNLLWCNTRMLSDSVLLARSCTARLAARWISFGVVMQ